MSAVARLYCTRAVQIQTNLGTRAGAGYLRNRMVTLNEALFILVGRVV